MIRPFDWRDVVLIHRLSRDGVCLHSQEALTRGLHVLQDALRGYLAPGSNRATFVWRRNGEAQRAFAQLETAPHSAHARVRFLAPANAEAYAAPWIGLLERLAVEAGARGMHHLVAEVDERSAEFELLRKVGFAVYARQDIYRRAPNLATDEVDLPLRPRQAIDALGVQILYNNIVPRLVQQVEPSPAAARTGYVLNQGGEVVAYLDVGRGALGVWMQPYLHPEVHDLIEDVLRAFLHKETQAARSPVYACVRSYQHGLRAALAECGFDLWGQQAVMVKRLAARSGEKQFKVLPTIEGAEVEITSPT